ncbi:MAG: hypothetical protein IKU98_00205 [Bacteroidaceae bacterium]|nr:hypothetical protein [Bacteroidaceae bacterium]
MSRKNRSGADFSELVALSNRVERAVRMADVKGSTFDRQKLIRKGGYILMDGLIKNTPLATKKSNPKVSNWFRYYYNPTDYGIGYGFSRGTLFGDTHYRGTLARGWVVRPNEVIDRPPHRKPLLAEGKIKVDETKIVRKSRNEFEMTFVNAAPFSMAVEVGHKNKVPRILGGDGGTYYRYTVGRRFTDKTVHEYQEKVWNEVGKEYAKMMKAVFKARGGK